MKCLLTRNEVNVVRERILTGHLQYKDVKEGDRERGAGVRFKTGEILRGEFYLRLWNRRSKEKIESSEQNE